MATDDDTDGEEHLTDAEQADIANRRAQRDKRQARNGDPVRAWGSPRVVVHVPCRRCRTPVPVTDGGIAAFKSMSALAVRRGLPPLEPCEVYICAHCVASDRKAATAQNRVIVDRMRDAVRRLRDGGTPEQERAALAYLEAHGNECRRDLEAMVERFREKRDGSKPKQEKGEF